MQPVKITIPGQFWDTQIYRGKLMLFSQSADVQLIEWDKLISAINVDDGLRLVVCCAFQRSDYLYGSNWDLFFNDPDVRSLVESKFETLSKMELFLTESGVLNCEYGRQSNPFPFPHSDTLIYNRQLFAVGDQGLFFSKFEPRRDRSIISKQPQKRWDCSTVSLAGSYGTLALAAGEEGLWEIPAESRYFDFDEPRQASEHDCDDCEFMYHSIFGASYEKGGFLAEFNKSGERGEAVVRSFSRELSGDQIFSRSGYSWGHKDKIYLAKNGIVQVAKYKPFGDDRSIEEIATVNIATWKGNFVSGGVATFGVVLEYDNAVIVMPSKGESVTIPGEVVRWRVFPGSRFYQNQLHLLYEDHIDIYSFNQDYFVDQDQKIFGTKMISPDYRNNMIVS